MMASVFPYVSQAAVGMACGVGDFLFCTTSQKICMLAGVLFEEIDTEDDIPASQMLDTHFWKMVVFYPVGEELVFRGLLQPFMAQKLAFYMPKLSKPLISGIPTANVISAVVLGMGFGMVHYFNYRSGGKQVALITSVSGVFYGMVKERYGLIASIFAHATHNYSVGTLDKYYPDFLDSTLKVE